MMNKPVTVACVQAAPLFMDLEGTVDKTIKLIEEAAAQGAELIAFPETWIPGYPWFLWLNSPAVNMPLVYEYHQNSLVLDSVQAKRIADAARHNGMMVVLGFSERDHGSLYISQWIIGSDGETIGTRRKLKATHVERTLFGESDGSSLTTGKRRSAWSARSAAGNICSRSRVTPCIPSMKRSTSPPGRASVSTTMPRRRWGWRSTRRLHACMRQKGNVSCWHLAPWFLQR